MIIYLCLNVLKLRPIIRHSRLKHLFIISYTLDFRPNLVFLAYPIQEQTDDEYGNLYSGVSLVESADIYIILYSILVTKFRKILQH